MLLSKRKRSRHNDELFCIFHDEKDLPIVKKTNVFNPNGCLKNQLSGFINDLVTSRKDLPKNEKSNVQLYSQRYQL